MGYNWERYVAIAAFVIIVVSILAFLLSQNHQAVQTTIPYTTTSAQTATNASYFIRPPNSTDGFKLESSVPPFPLPHLNASLTGGFQAVYDEINNSQTKLLSRLLRYANISSAESVYNFLKNNSVNTTLSPLTGLPANSFGNEFAIGNQTGYSITAMDNSYVMTITLLYPGNENVPTSSAVSVLVGALNSTVSVLR